MRRVNCQAFEWIQASKTSFTGESVEALQHTFTGMRYDDGTEIMVEAWPVPDGSGWWVTDKRGALDHHLGPQGAVGVALALWDTERLFGVQISGDYAVYKLLPVEPGQAPAQADLDEAAYVVCAVSALVQRARYQPIPLRIS